MSEDKITPNSPDYSCCICGGGPAGMMLAFILARAGINIIVLEKHKDFFRDFRGDTIHPSTIQLMYELGILDDFLAVHHQELSKLTALYNGSEFTIADFTHLPVVKKVLGLMPQWDFLNFIEKKANNYPAFHLQKETEVTDIIWQNDRVVGVRTNTPKGEKNIYANVIIGTDGRHSIIRQKASLKVITKGVPIDVLWFRLSRQKTDPVQALGRFEHGRIMITLQRDGYWQCAYVIAKGDYENIRSKGISFFRNEILTAAPFFTDRVNELNDWDNLKLLSVAIDHLEKWYCNGLLCIGDAAHAMSPIGGVGINLAIQDAVAAANILYEPLSQHKNITTAILASVQKRRSFPTAVIQRVQMFLHAGIINRKNDKDLQQKMPLFFKILKSFPFFSRIPGRIVGMGVRPEHIKIPDVLK